MIIVDDVHKRYRTEHGPGKWVLQGVSFTIPANTNVGLVGRNGAGKSTLLRIIGGVDQPTRGRVERRCRVSWPMGFGGGLQGSLTGRQNAKFICRIHGHEDDIPERLAFIQAFAEIGDAFDEPTKTYSSGMRSRLQFALSLAFDFDIYISDEVTATGDAAFRKKAADAFKGMVGRAGLIMVSHGEGTLKEFCSAGIWLNEGRAHWFDDINDALKAYKESLEVKPAPLAGVSAQPSPRPVPVQAKPEPAPASRAVPATPPANELTRTTPSPGRPPATPAATARTQAQAAPTLPSVQGPRPPAPATRGASAQVPGAAHAGPPRALPEARVPTAAPQVAKPVPGVPQRPGTGPGATANGTTSNARLNHVRASLDALAAGLNGQPETLREGEAARVVRHAKLVGMELLSAADIAQRGWQLKQGAIPVLRGYSASPDQHVELYDLRSQCVEPEKT